MLDYEHSFFRNMEQKICYHCTPVFLGLKAANTVTVQKDAVLLLPAMLRGTCLKYCSLACQKNNHVLLIYRPKKLEEALNRKDAARLLYCFGYTGTGLDANLKRLSKRFCSFQSGQAEFPHELGVFLEYPVCDVVGFMEQGGKNYLLSGYWKVYQNAKEAAGIFEQYDWAKARLFQILTRGVHVNELFVNKNF